MAGDGVSLQTNLLQLSRLAKSQARNQAAPHAPNLAQELKQQDVAATEKVRETEKSEQDGVDPDGKNERERRRRRREEEERRAAEGTDGAEGAAADDADDEAGLGGLIDIKA